MEYPGDKGVGRGKKFHNLVGDNPIEEGDGCISF